MASTVSSVIPLRHRLMMLVGNQLQEAGAMKAAMYQLRMAHRMNIHPHIISSATASNASRYHTPSSSSSTSSSSAGGNGSVGGTARPSSGGVAGVGHRAGGGMPSSDWSWQSLSWNPYRNVSSCWTPFRGWHRWACAGRHNYGGRYDGDWCSPHRWGRHSRRDGDWTPEQLQQWQQFEKQLWRKAEDWSKWAVRWGEEVARATERTAAEWSAQSSHSGPSSTAWTSTSSYNHGGQTRTLTISMREQPSQYLVEVATPGLPRDHIKISLHDGRLTIATRPSPTANNTTTATTTGTAVTNTATEASTEAASEEVDSVGHIDLPSDVNISSISAHYANGMLTMSLPKRIIPTTDIPIQ